MELYKDLGDIGDLSKSIQVCVEKCPDEDLNS